ncbi:MAG: hypothetical protein KC486_05740, partial [Myxococcales bacterium]|nr:hypothetical protein [Myxococcales bacterium]
VWDATTGEHVATLQGHDNDVVALAYSPDGARIATASLDKTARVWDAVSHALVATLHGHRGDVYDVTFSP